MRKAVLITVAAAAIGAGLVSPAGAADTTTTFALTAGSLTISAPASKNLGSAATGTATITAQLGSTTVTDARGTLLGSWTASVSSTDFTTGLATADETVGKAVVDYWSGLATGTTGTGTFTPGQVASVNKQALSASRTAFSAAAVIGNNSATWNPTLVVNVPVQAVVGTYSGTVTHSVA